MNHAEPLLPGMAAENDPQNWPGIVSVWADRSGRAVVWQRLNDQIVCSRERFRPWLFATSLDDLKASDAAIAPDAAAAPITYHALDGNDPCYRYLITARPGYALERTLLRGATQRLGRAITSLRELDDTYYQVGPVEQYLMQTGRVYFRGLQYADLHRLQFDLETTALDPAQGRIFMIAVRDNRGFATTLEAPSPDDEPRLIADLCTLIRGRDPDVIENHNLFGFDLPFLEFRAAAHLERGQHDGQQAAMKTLINSAYGYLGAGRMALFADRRAADEVTRRGRAVLDQVVAGLRARGMALIEGDTDGVYFAVPEQWNEDDERALVAEVAATLPDGIRLEYEGRYAAMFSHEVKNYALLRYDGAVIMRGVALRSSRAEPYGERFLREALRCTLNGDILGVRATFRATIAALRDRALPAADVATRVRLSKTPAAYLNSREKHREIAYEALVAAGRSEWTVGERVRVFRAQDGSAVWLPDNTERDEFNSDTIDRDDRRDYDINYYVNFLVTSYAGRLKKALAPHDWEQLFRLDDQQNLFDQPFDTIEPIWIRCDPPQTR